eukprot:TRINITY_DN5536_c0_g1_i1.p1 TRINITY_DN5536_c0_g1~~TRINITY_DN5536_c0_g1_i1.p1  ORF type:complete len:526 (-),score=131.00 TRINITY_DN5536_c0_g1_i1:100-1677(-)
MVGTTETQKDNKDSTSTSTTTTNEERPLFEDLDPSSEVTEIESLCMNCHENGITKIMLTKVPYFREIIIMNFECPHCDYTSKEIQYGGKIEDKGARLELTVKNARDLNRQVVKSDTATVTIPSLEFEIPAQTQKGSINTIEGFLSQSIDGLEKAQVLRRIEDAETADKIDSFISLLTSTLHLEKGPFVFVVDDPSGNSYIENPLAPNEDPQLKITHYVRTEQQDIACGLTPHTHANNTQAHEQAREKINQQIANTTPSTTTTTTTTSSYTHPGDEDKDKEKEVMTFPDFCTSCGEPGELRMVQTSIPYFKDIVLMAYNCEYCGYKSNEIKAGGAISAKGRRITLKVENLEDLSRDILKSETANVYIPELDLHLGTGTLGGRFTTIEGLLSQILDELESNPFVRGDSSDPEAREKYNHFVGTLTSFLDGTKKFTIELDDPVANSHIQNLFAPDPDPNMTIEDYERDWQQNEDLGLNDIKTENYGEDEHDEKEESEKHEKEEKGKENVHNGGEEKSIEGHSETKPGG